MQLSQYINYRNRNKNTLQHTEYQIRAQHFYDGKPMKVKGLVYPGIKANFMNGLAVPDPSAIAHLQKKHFATMANTKAQSKTLLKLQGLNNPSAFQVANAQLEQQTLVAINQLETAIDQILKEKNKLEKILQNKSVAPNYADLNGAFLAFQKIYSNIKNQMGPAHKTDKYIQDLDNIIANANAQIQSNPAHLLDKKAYKNSTGKNTSFINKLMNLSYQIKGVSLMEHQAIEFIQKHVKIPKDIEFVGVGQIYVGGKQASQDALFFDKNLEITLTNGTKVKLKDFLNNVKNSTSSISITYDEWDNILNQGAIGLQSKYSRWGNIKMTSMSLKDLFTSAYADSCFYIRALRNMYILKNQVDYDKRALITHPFNVKKSKDYNLLFSTALAKFMDKIIKSNYYMVTKEYGIIDSYTYYNTLFNKHNYFHPQGDIDLSISALNKDYGISIKET